MPNKFQEQFNGGELGLEMMSRFDLPHYNKSCKTLKNFRISLQGSAIKRNGFAYKYNTKHNDKKSRLLKFIFNETDNVIIEMGEYYFRFIDNGTQVESSGSPYEVVHTYTEAQLPFVKYRQIGDILYIVHPDHPPRKLVRVASNNWTLSQIDFLRGPSGQENEDETITMYISSSSSTANKGQTCTITASSSVFDSSQVGFVYRLKNTSGSEIGYAKMTGYTSATEATFENQTNNSVFHGSGNAIYRWTAPAFSGNNGYPRAISFHEQRLILAGTAKYPLSIWGSVSGGAYENFEEGNDDDDAFQFELAGQVNVIQWLASDGLYLTAGTLGGIGFIGTGSLESALTPTNVKANLSGSHGCNSVDALLLAEEIFYISSNSSILYELNYNSDTLRYNSLNITSHNQNILSGVSYFDKLEQPDLTLLMVSGGDLICILRDKINNVAGWHRYETEGDIESVAVIPTAGNDQVWITVKRNNKRFIEVLSDINSNIFLDSAIEYSGTATRTITGLTHLEGLDVSVLGNEAYIGDYTVSSGQIVIPNDKNEITQAIVGLSYNADIETMPLDLQSSQYYTLKGQKKRINRSKIIVFNSGSFSIGHDFNNLEVVAIRNTKDNMDEKTPFWGSNYPVTLANNFNGKIGYNPTFCLRSNLPYPMTLQAVQLEFTLGDD